MKELLRRFLGQRLINYYHLAGAIIANVFYGFPSHKLQVIGVTGTDGKTTVINLIASALKHAGLKVSFLSTINAEIGSQKYGTGLHTTTPSPFLLQRLLRKMVKAGSEYAVLEVTSHGLDQFRTWGIRFETAVITNIKPEHLDYHKTYEAYLQAKAKLFTAALVSVLNIDDESYERLAKLNHQKIITYGLSREADIWAEQIKESLTGTEFVVHLPGGGGRVKTSLPGKFNVYNVLAAVAVGLAYQIPFSNITQGLEAVKAIGGRIEFLEEGQDFLAMIDFAHTPNALEKLLSFLRPKVSGRIIIVFGAAGERDRTKRPAMGAVADKYADIVIITREDNRSEKAEDICQDIAEGLKHKKFKESLFIIPDRREAIKFGLNKAKKGDLVVATGKGHEQSLNIDGTEHPWDDRQVMKEELRKLVSSIKK